MTAPRVRFAPSPSGQLHVGNARTALFNWMIARRHGGVFILRIEDTDTERSTLASEHAILDDLRWLGLDWDEGPEVGGPYGPYRQSERQLRYASAADALLANGQAYYCFCTPADLEADRQTALARGEAPKYSGRCRSLDLDAAKRRIQHGESAAVRFAVPSARDVSFTDIVRGEVTFGAAVLGDPVMLRSDGRPAYNFAVVVDDAAMAVTHVVRGEDHISNTPRQVLMYEALGHRPPAFAHLSLVLGPDHAPLSKRHGATSVAEFRARGYLPESLVNYLALIGWSPGEGQELLPIDEMARRFDLSSVTKSAGIFDVDKLAWVNRHYMQQASPARLVREALPFFRRAGLVNEATDAASAFLESLLPMALGSVDRLEDLPSRLMFLFGWEAEAATVLLRGEPDGEAAVTAFAKEIADLGPLDRETFRAAAGRTRAVTGLKGKALFHPLRVALTASDSGPELDLAVPAIDRGAAIGIEAGIAPIASCAERLARVCAGLEGARERRGE